MIVEVKCVFTVQWQGQETVSTLFFEQWQKRSEKL